MNLGFDSCCCGCASLETGCKIVAALEMLSAVFLLVEGVMVADHALANAAVLAAALGAALFAGVVRRMEAPILVYLVVSPMVVIADTAINVADLVAVHQGIVGVGTVFMFTLGLAVGLGLCFYAWTVVFSFYKKIKSGDIDSVPLV